MDRVLFIDDEPNVLSAFQRTLRSEFEVVTAGSGDQGIAACALETFPVVVCDMRMAGMDGVETLKRIASASPTTTRVMLTGNADRETAARAINEGHIFRFLTKPCPDTVLREVIRSGIRQHQLVTAEKELLEKTLAGSVRVLTDVLGVSLPETYGRVQRVRQWASILSKDVGFSNGWEIGLAASLFALGLIGVPEDVAAKVERRKELSKGEKEMIEQAPETAFRLISHIPRLKNVAQIVLNQDRGYDGSGFPKDGPIGDDIPEGARVLKILKDLAAAGDADVPDAAMIRVLRGQAALYDPQLLQAVQRLWGHGGASAAPAQRVQSEVSIDGLLPGDKLLSDITQVGGKLLLSAGLNITMVQIERLKALRKLEKIVEPIRVGRLKA